MNRLVKVVNPTTLAWALVLLLANHCAKVAGAGDANAWLMYYLFDAALVVTAALLSGYVGFSGFFAMVSISTAAFTAVWASEFGRFFLGRSSALVELGPASKYPGLETGLVLYVDQISYSFALLTSLISLFVYFYAFSYMRFEKNILNFLVYFKLFGWSMTLLVLAGSWFTLLLGWELIGLTSFLLINYWISKITTLKSAFKAFVFNKVSDAALIAALCLSLAAGSSYVNGSLAFAQSMAGAQIVLLGAHVSYASVFLVFLCVAAFCKSAQFGFHFWLPDSMEAPVPASALIHSATLVSAGIYLLLRFNAFFVVCPSIEAAFALLTAFTAFFGAVIASFQTDVKKILAYSTISHCGLLMFSIVMHSPFVTLFYLFAHGFFKSINFMCVGNFIQSSNNYQDVSRMGRFFALYRFEFYFFCVTLFNLSSAPLFLAFFSKHWLLGLAYTNGVSGSAAVAFVYGAAFCGAFYSSKLLFECSLAHKRAHSSVYSVNSFGRHSYLFRRSNALSRFAMSGLLLVSFVCLYVMWGEAFSGLQLLNDGYNASSSVLTGSSAYQTHVLFSVVLLLLFLGYTAFKRDSVGAVSYLPSAVCFIALAILI